MSGQLIKNWRSGPVVTFVYALMRKAGRLLAPGNYLPFWRAEADLPQAVSIVDVVYFFH